VTRILASLGIVLLFALDLALPATPIGRRGTEARARRDVPSAFAASGAIFPDFVLPDLEGVPVRLSELRGQRVILTFERSVDW